MTFESVFARIVAALETAEIPYMLTGSFASSYHGAPRATQDIDLVIAATPAQLRRFISLLPAPRYYVDEGAALEAQAQETSFNVLDPETGWKIDLIARRSRPYSIAEFDRRVPVELAGMRIFIATAEDVLLAKLEWAKLGESQRQIEDAAGILRIRGPELDRAYLDRWIPALGVQRQWDAALRLAGQSGRE